ncbi:MAG: response regulator [Acidobacteria bacterium]|nr:response regulator [Acidobacteriota bacterium]
MDAKNAPAMNIDSTMLPPATAAILETVFDLFGVLDTDGRVVSVTGRIFRGMNTNPELLKGQAFSETVFWQSSEMTSKLLAKAISGAASGGNARLIVDFRVSADDKVPMEVSVQPLPGFDLVFISGQTVSERRLRAGQTREAREQLLFAAENAAIGLWFWDFAEDRIYSTASCNELFGLAAYETFRYEDFREAIHAEDREFVDHFLADSRDRGSKYEEEFRVVYSDGSMEWLSAEGRSFLDENGKPQRMTGVVRKITEQKLAAEEIAKVHEREKKAREEAVEANRAKDFFLAFVSHELRGQLNNILGWLNIARTKSVDEEKRENALAIVERSARQQKKLIDDLVDSARVASGRLRLEYYPTNLYEIVRNSWQAHLPSAQERNIQLEFSSDRESVPLFGDASRLLQVFGNLLSNALKYTPEGGRVSINIETSDESVRVQVVDTGQGIDPDQLPNVFRQFSAVAADRFNPGLGLGLSIVKILVTKHGGIVRAESEGVGKGSAFTVSLPLTETPLADDVEPTSRPVRGKPLAGMTILIVEDDPDSREVLEFFLSEKGARVRSCDSVRSALTSFGANGLPHIIISDLGMPDEDGYSFIQKVRGLPMESGGAVPAIALSAFTSEESRRKALELGFSKYCTKPFEHDQLVKDVLELLDRN